MTRLTRCMLVVACISFATGCSVGLIGTNRAEYNQTTRGIVATGNGDPVISEKVDVGLPSRPSVDDYVRVAMARNPAIVGALSRARAAGYAIAEATGLQDPVLSIVPPSGGLAETAAGQVDGSIGIRQEIPLPNKLYARGRAASQAAVSARENYRAVRLETIAAVRQAYYGVYFADRSIELTGRSRELLRDFRAIAIRKYEAGQVPQQDVLRAQVELAGLENELIVLRRTRYSAQARLNYLMAGPAGRELPLTAAIAPAAVELVLDDLIATAQDVNPEIGVARGELERAREQLVLAKLDYLPDLTVDYTHTAVSNSGLSPVANGDDSDRLMLGFTVPIWFERLSASSSAARERVAASENELHDTVNVTKFKIEDSFRKAQSRRQLMDLFSGVILPQAQQTLDATKSAYRAGDVDFLTFIENWRRLLDFEIAYHRNLSDFEQELAELEKLVGGALPGRRAGAVPWDG